MAAPHHVPSPDKNKHLKNDEQELAYGKLYEYVIK
jgi:hypothetical protein